MPKQASKPSRIVYAVDPLPGGICERCGSEHLAYEDPDILDFLLNDLGVEPEVIDEWKQKEIEGGKNAHAFVPRAPTKLGRPKLRGDEGDLAEKNRLKQARYRERQKAEREGASPPKWAKKQGLLR